MINWHNKEDSSWEGSFTSRFFCDDENGHELSIGIENSSLADYAEKCVQSFNSLPDDVIDKLCTKIIKCAKRGDDEFKHRSFDNVRDILKYCWFTMVYVGAPKNPNQASYVVEGEGEWGEEIGFAVKNDKLVYVGVDYFDYLK